MDVAVQALAVGDRVYLKTDPEKAEGTIADILHARPFVRWDNGRTWVYPSSWLAPVEACDCVHCDCGR